MAQYAAGALIDENGRIVGGKAGDQGGEVTRHALSSRWTYILRPPKNGAKMAWTAAEIAKSPCFGYDQGGRTTGFSALKKVGWDPRKVTANVELDCSCLVAAVCNSAGYTVPASMWTGNEIEILEGVGFDRYTFSKSKLKIGDVLWRDGHTEVYIGTTMDPERPSDGKAETKGGASGAAGKVSEAAPGKGFGGTYRCNAAAVRIRKSPSLKGAVVGQYIRGETVVLDPWYKIAEGYVWGRYTGATSGQKRYVAVGPYTGKAETDDYFVKVK